MYVQQQIQQPFQDDELVVARGILKDSKYGYLYIQNEYPRRFGLQHL